jgi:predicted CXXCH cytochrome family protein
MPECPECGRELKRLGGHRCCVTKLANFDVGHFVNLPRNVSRCTRCHDVHVMTMNANMMRTWRDEKLCVACYNGDESITFTTSRLKEQTSAFVLETHGEECALCRKKTHAKYELDHVNIFEKSASVSVLVFTGADIETIINEVKFCRVLCVPCHRAVCAAEKQLGISQVRKVPYFIDNVDDSQQQFIETVDIAAKSLLNRYGAYTFTMDDVSSVLRVRPSAWLRSLPNDDINKLQSLADRVHTLVGSLCLGDFDEEADIFQAVDISSIDAGWIENAIEACERILANICNGCNVLPAQCAGEEAIITQDFSFITVDNCW